MLPQGALLPSYDGRGLANVPTSSLAPFGRLPGALPPLDEAVLPAELLEGVERVVVLVVDGLGWDQLRAHVEREPDLGFAALVRDGSAAPATSVAPSTTVAALTTLATGVAPLAHGMLGYRMLMPSLGTTVNAIRMAPLFGGRPLPDLGVDLNLLQPHPTIFERLEELDVRAEGVTRGAYLDSALSRIVYRGARMYPYAGLGEMFAATRKRLAAAGDGKLFLRVYWDGIDGVAHDHGPTASEHEAEMAALDYSLHREILSRVRDRRALLLVTADHGHIPIPPERVVTLNRHPGLLQELTVPPTGEGRFSFLHVRDGRRERARAYAEEHLGHACAVVDQEKLVASGMFGPPERAHPEARARLGDLALLAREGWRFVYDPTPQTGPPMLAGHHGGLFPGEMLVPVLAKRLN